MKKIFLSALTGLVLTSTHVLAQTERLPGVVDRDFLDAVPEGMYNAPPEQSEAPGPKREQPRQRVRTGLIRSITVEGVTVLKQEQIASLTQRYVGRGLDENDLADLKYLINKTYFDEGYILVKVVAPAQDFASGALKLQVIEGRIGSITQRGDALRPQVAQGLLSRVNVGEVFNEKKIETSLNDINELENVRARMQLAPGERLGTTAMFLDVENVQEDLQAFSVSNYGSPLTSRVFGTLDLQKSNWLRFGETLSARLNAGFDGNIVGGRVGWFSPLPKTDWFFDASYSVNDITIGGPFAALQATGDSHIGRLGLSHNIWNTARGKLTVGFGAEHRIHDSFLAGIPETSDELTKLVGYAAWTERWQNTTALARLDLLQGIDMFGGTQMGDPLSTRVAGDPEALIIAPSVQVQHRFSEKDSFFGLVRAQASGSTLLSSDLFSIGGYGSVRGFDPGFQTGEYGVSANFEYRRQMFENNLFAFALRPFVDVGFVGNRLAGNATDPQLYSAGLGFDLTFNSPWQKLGRTELRVDVGNTLGTYSVPTNDTFIYASVRQVF